MNINDTSTQLLFTTVPIVGITTEGTASRVQDSSFPMTLKTGEKCPCSLPTTMSSRM